jgi:hypothetical protein
VIYFNLPRVVPRHESCFQLRSATSTAFRASLALATSIARSADATTAIFDEEIVCLDRNGRSGLDDLLFRCGKPRFVAFDLLYLDGKDPATISSPIARPRSVNCSLRDAQIQRCIGVLGEVLQACERFQS